tara:strand:- start:1134 stop:1337 length:204 start_codon:yes stop_codon:yes gene_type:complete
MKALPLLINLTMNSLNVSIKGKEKKRNTCSKLIIWKLAEFVFNMIIEKIIDSIEFPVLPKNKKFFEN